MNKLIISRKQNRKGFTLVEMIIAVAILALLSILVLQLFLSSASVNQKAYDLDKSVLSAKNAIEVFKADNTPQSGESYVYFDKDWKLITQKDDKEPANSEFILHIIVSERNQKAVQPTQAGLFDIKTTMTKKSAYIWKGSPNTVIYQLDASKYFQGGGKG